MVEVTLCQLWALTLKVLIAFLPTLGALSAMEEI